jgi:hypothetical protein
MDRLPLHCWEPVRLPANFRIFLLRRLTILYVEMLLVITTDSGVIFHTHQSVLDGNITAEGSVWLAGTRFIRGTSFRGRSVAGLSGF